MQLGPDNRLSNQKVERETGVVVPGTKHPVEFSYRLAGAQVAGNNRNATRLGCELLGGPRQWPAQSR